MHTSSSVPDLLHILKEGVSHYQSSHTLCIYRTSLPPMHHLQVFFSFTDFNFYLFPNWNSIALSALQQKSKRYIILLAKLLAKSRWLGKQGWVQGCHRGGKRSPTAFRSGKGVTLGTAATVGWHYSVPGCDLRVPIRTVILQGSEERKTRTKA